MSVDARELAEKQFKYLNKQIRKTKEKINGLAPTEEEERKLRDFIIICEQQRTILARKYGLRLDFESLD